MKIEEIKKAEAEAERFLSRVNDLWDAMGQTNCKRYMMANGSPETGAVRRASMDLTRQLAKMRK